MKLEPIEIITGDTQYPAPFTHRVLILCEEKNIPYTLTYIDTEQKPDWFLEIAPLALIPVVRIKDKVVFDSHAICEYLDVIVKPHYLPSDPMDAAQYKSWLMFADELSQEISTLVKQGNINNANLHRLNALFGILNQRLDGPYFFGDNFGLIDIYLVSHILWIDALEQKIFPNYFLKNFTKISQWLINMKHRPSVSKTMGDNYAFHFLELLSRYNLVP